MSVPKKKHTKSAVGQNRSHQALKRSGFSLCAKCGQAVLPHHACAFCGNYNSREAVKIKTKTKKK